MTFVFYLAADDVTLPSDPNWNNTKLALTFNGTNGGTNNTFLDSSSNAVTLTSNNTSSLYLGQGSYGPQTGFKSGQFPGNAAVYLSTPTSTNYNFGSGDYTIESWIKTSSNTTQDIATWFNPTGNYIGWIFGIGVVANDGKLKVFHGNSTQTQQQVAAGNIVVNNGLWHHVAVSKSGTTIRIFVDGVLDTATTSSVAVGDHPHALRVGLDCNTSPGRPFNGYMSNLRITKGTALYTSAFTPSTTPLTSSGSTSLLLKFENASVIDHTLINNITTVGSTQLSTAQFKEGLSSLTLGAVGNFAYATPSSDWNLTAVDSTIEFWIYPTTLVPGLLVGQSSASNDTKWAIYSSNNSGAIAIGRIGASELASATNISANTWSHVAVVRTQSNNTTKIYINGTLTATGTGTYYSNSSTSNLYIGTPTGAPWTGMPGYMDNLRITRGVARYTANFTPESYMPIS